MTKGSLMYRKSLIRVSLNQSRLIQMSLKLMNQPDTPRGSARARGNHEVDPPYNHKAVLLDAELKIDMQIEHFMLNVYLSCVYMW